MLTLAELENKINEQRNMVAFALAGDRDDVKTLNRYTMGYNTGYIDALNWVIQGMADSSKK